MVWRYVQSLIFDFKKAFDSVPHQILLQKLTFLGLDSYVVSWVHDYLCGRTQSVVVDGAESDVASVLSGVPQGSVLGPLLFLIYINDLPGVALHPSATVNLFADDVLFYHYVSKSSDYLTVQTLINCIQQWSSDHYFCLNALKCKYMLISRKKQPLQPIHPLVLNGESLEKVDTYKYLGILQLLSSGLSWSPHISSICKKILGLIYRRFYSNADQDTIKQLYNITCKTTLRVWKPSLGSAPS